MGDDHYSHCGPRFSVPPPDTTEPGVLEIRWDTIALEPVELTQRRTTMGRLTDVYSVDLIDGLRLDVDTRGDHAVATVSVYKPGTMDGERTKSGKDPNWRTLCCVGGKSPQQAVARARRELKTIRRTLARVGGIDI